MTIRKSENKLLHALVYFSKVDCEAMKLGRLLNLMIGNAFLFLNNQHLWQKIPIEGGLH